MQWLAKHLGNTPISIPEGVPVAWVEGLEKYLESLYGKPSAKIPAGIALDILNFVLHGQPITVLSEITRNSEIAEQLWLDKILRKSLYKHFTEVAPEVGLRWAKLLNVAATAQSFSLTFYFPMSVTWPEALLAHNAQRGKTESDLSAAYFEKLLCADGLEPASLLVAAYQVSPSQYNAPEQARLVTYLAGYSQALEQHLEAIRPQLLVSSVAQRLQVLELLAPAGPSCLKKLAPELSQLATSGSKQVRAAASSLLRTCGDHAWAPLQELALTGKPEQRIQALNLIYQWATQQQNAVQQDWARQTAAADKAATVQALLKDWAAEAGEEIDLDYPVPVIDWRAEANQVAPELLDKLWQETNERLRKEYRLQQTYWDEQEAAGEKAHRSKIRLYDETNAEALRRFMASDSLQRPNDSPRLRTTLWWNVSDSVEKLAKSGALTPVAALKLLMFFDEHIPFMIFELVHQSTGRPSLLELAMMLEKVGQPADSLIEECCQCYSRFAADWPAEDLWPYFASQLDNLLRLLTEESSYYFDQQMLYRALSLLPRLPAKAVNALFAVALGPLKSSRLLAQQTLEKVPGKEARIIEALGNGKAEVRMLAAQWLGRLRHGPALAALEQALSKEKNDLAKGALLDALQALGQPVEYYLKREDLATEARKLLAKGLPKELDWFPWQALPQMHWTDGQPVPLEVLQWLLAQACKQKQPEPNAVLRQYCSMFNAKEREALGQFILEAWLHQDTLPISAEEALQRANNTAQQYHQWMTQYPQYYQNDPQLGWSVEQLTSHFLPMLMRQPAGTAIGSKGLLAVVAVCAAERAAGSTQRYLKEWRGTRAAQGKALIAMLAWIEHPSATQLMLAIASRFRTKGFQEEASKQAEALAERKGWSLNELADRTIPSAGFDEDGLLELSYGERVFQAKLLADLKIQLCNTEGKTISALPEPRQTDDAEQAKDAKKAFSAAKKQVKEILKLQTERLYEALCTERSWLYEDWQTYLYRHPIMRHLVQRLVWVQLQDGVVQQIFRPLDDGSLTDCDDNPVTLADNAEVRLAHDSLLSNAQVSAWQAHLQDYAISPLFQQLGKGRYQLPAELAKEQRLEDFQGHLLQAFALRNRALKLGYVRGQAEDAGWFYGYEKHFPTLGLRAEIEFTGNGLPEENRQVALLNLSFTRTSGGLQNLGQIPAILLAECYNDLRLIAAEGSGFAADWQKKTDF